MAQWSVDDTILAVGSEDQRIAVYNSSGPAKGSESSAYKLMYKLVGFNKSSGPPRSIDFSIDTEYMRCAAGDGDIIFARTAGVKRPGGSIQPDTMDSSHVLELRSIQWATNTCAYAWRCGGLHPMEPGGDDIVSIDVSERYRLILASDETGRVILTRDPHAEHGGTDGTYSISTRMGGSLGGEVDGIKLRSKVCFFRAGCRFLTLGQQERCIVQWTYSEPGVPGQRKRSGEHLTGVSQKFDPNDIYGGLPQKITMSERYRNIQNRPWISSLVYPSGFIKEDHNLSRPELVQNRLKRVVGFSPLHVYQSRDGDLLYHAAALGIRFNVQYDRQEFYFGHCPNEIVGMHVGGGGRIVATGERAPSPEGIANIHVWSATTCSPLGTLPPFHRVAVPLLSVSSDGAWILSVGHDKQHTAALWRAEGGPAQRHIPDWSRGRFCDCTQIGTRSVCFCVLLNGRERRNNTENARKEFDAVIGGVDFVTFLRIQGESLVVYKTVLTVDLRGLGGVGGAGAAWMSNDERPNTAKWLASLSRDGNESASESEDALLLTPNKDGKLLSRSMQTEQMDASLPLNFEDESMLANTPVGSQLCCALVAGKEICTGDAEGQLLTWHLSYGDPVGRRKNAHVGEIWCIASPPYTSTSRSQYAAANTTVIVSGGEDGYVRVWDRDLNCIGAYSFPTIDMSSGNPENVFWGIKSLSCVEIRDSSFRVAFASEDCRMFTFALPGAGHISTTRLVQESHHSRELCALAPHPIDSDLFATGGDDSTLRIWRLSNLRMLEKRQLPTMCRAVCWSPDGNLIAVGLGGGSPNPEERRLDGSWVVFKVENQNKGNSWSKGINSESDSDDDLTGPNKSRRGRKRKRKRKKAKKKKKKKAGIDEMNNIKEELTLRVEHHGRDATQYVTTIAFSPSGNFLAVGSLDTKISVYDVVRGYVRRSVCATFNGFVSHFDWSLDSTHIRANSGFFELAFYHVCGEKLDASGDVNDGEDALVLTPKEARDIIWATANCTLSWNNLGIWPVDRNTSNINTTDLAISKQCFGKGIGRPDTGLIAAGQDDGVIRLYRYPAANRAAKYVSLIGHAPHISAVRWTTDESLLLSTGASDKCIMIWDVKDEDDPVEDS